MNFYKRVCSDLYLVMWYHVRRHIVYFFNTRMCSLQEKGDLQILTPHFRNFQRLVQLIRCPLQLLSRLLSMQTERVTFSCNMGQSFRPPKFNQLLVYFIEGHQSPRSPLIFGYDIGLDMFACFFRMVVLVLQLIDVSWVYIGLHCKKSLFCPRCDGLGRRGLAVGSRRDMVETWSPEVLRRVPSVPNYKWHPFESSANSESSQHMSNGCNKLCKRTFKIFKSGISLNFGQCSSTVNLEPWHVGIPTGIFRGWNLAARHASPSEACEWNLPWSLSQYYKLWTKEWLATHWMVIVLSHKGPHPDD